MVNFKCCKNKPVPSYYICTKCLNVFHQACALRSKNKLKFLKDNKVICCSSEEEDLDNSSILVKSMLEKTIEELSEETIAKDKYIQKMKSDMGTFIKNAEKSEEELNELIRKQERMILEAKLYIEQLQKTNELLSTKPTCSIGTQTKSRETKQTFTQTIHSRSTSTSQQTDNEKPVTNDVGSQVPERSLRSPKQIKLPFQDRSGDASNKHGPVKPKILFVMGCHGKGLLEGFLNQTEMFRVFSVVKPYADINDLVSTALQYSKNFTKRDTVVLWSDKPHQDLVSAFIRKLEHTNPLVLTQPYCYNSSHKIAEIYRNNLSLYKNLHSKETKFIHVLDCNSILRKSNYHRNGYHITKRGKWFLGKSLIRHIKENFLYDPPSQEVFCKNVHFTESKTNGSEVEINVTESEKEKNDRYNFLYPSLIEMRQLERVAS